MLRPSDNESSGTDTEETKHESRKKRSKDDSSIKSSSGSDTDLLVGRATKQRKTRTSDGNGNIDDQQHTGKQQSSSQAEASVFPHGVSGGDDNSRQQQRREHHDSSSSRLLSDRLLSNVNVGGGNIHDSAATLSTLLGDSSHQQMGLQRSTVDPLTLPQLGRYGNVGTHLQDPAQQLQGLHGALSLQQRLAQQQLLHSQVQEQQGIAQDQHLARAQRIANEERLVREQLLLLREQRALRAQQLEQEQRRRNILLGRSDDATRSAGSIHQQLQELLFQRQSNPLQNFGRDQHTHEQQLLLQQQQARATRESELLDLYLSSQAAQQQQQFGRSPNLHRAEAASSDFYGLGYGTTAASLDTNLRMDAASNLFAARTSSPIDALSRLHNLGLQSQGLSQGDRLLLEHQRLSASSELASQARHGSLSSPQSTATAAARSLGSPDRGTRVQPSLPAPDSSPDGLPAVLARPDDENKLSAHQVFLRHQIEAFQATEDDINTHTRGRNKPIKLKQVGIRCRHCAHMPVSKRQKGSTYFPATIMGLYQAAQNMGTTHLQCGLCSEMPQEFKDEFVRLLETKVASSGAGRPFWADAARELGLVDTTEGIFFHNAIPDEAVLTAPVAAAAVGSPQK